jgi:melibiose permease/lactose/raffinose/galactose permease
MFSIFGVKEKPLDTKLKKEEALKLKDIFRTIFKNDQLLISALVLLILSIGTGVVTGGLSMSYFYFEFGYEGGWFTTVGIGGAVTSIAFTLLYPWLSKKFGRDKLLYFTLSSIIIGYAILLVFGLCFSAGDYLSTNWWIKFVVMFIINAVTGFGGGYYMIMIINIANTIEYNEWKHGRRDEGLIFSLRPFTAKMGSALQQGLVSAVYLIAGVLTFTNQISSIENGVSKGTIDAEMKNALIAEVTSSVPEESKMILLACMCAIPMVFALVALIIYKKKFYLSESTLDRMMAEIKERNRLMAISDGDVAEQVAFDDAKQ